MPPETSRISHKSAVSGIAPSASEPSVSCEASNCSPSGNDQVAGESSESVGLRPVPSDSESTDVADLGNRRKGLKSRITTRFTDVDGRVFEVSTGSMNESCEASATTDVSLARSDGTSMQNLVHAAIGVGASGSHYNLIVGEEIGRAHV